MTPERLEHPYGQLDEGYGRTLATTPPGEDGPVWMVNLVRYRERAVYADGSDGGATGREADDRYAPLDVLAGIGAAPVLVADVSEQLLGAEPRWDRVAVVRYPTRRAFAEMESRQDFRERHVHKAAGVETTIVMGGVPQPTPVVPGSVDWAEVPHPPTEEDGPVVVVHVIRWADGGGRETMRGYEEAAAAAAAPHGLRVVGWFDVEGTILGDGRRWDQVRFNAFPSRRAFQAVLTDPHRLEAQSAHRAPAMADTYTMVLRPTMDLERLPASLPH